MRQFYEDTYSKGFEYAYLYPGMNRVVQSAGRIVRSETDRGSHCASRQAIRYENYSRLLPEIGMSLLLPSLQLRNFANALSEFWAQ